MEVFKTRINKLVRLSEKIGYIDAKFTEILKKFISECCHKGDLLIFLNSNSIFREADEKEYDDILHELEKESIVKITYPLSERNIKRFILNRKEDKIGLSGTGKVAEGIIFSDYSVCLRWLGETSSIVIHKNIENVKKIHCFNDMTEIIMIDE